MTTVITTTPQEAAQWLANGEAVLIDVREPDEFKETHIAYAMSLPLSGLPDLLIGMKLPPDRKVVFQCHSGNRSYQACAIARDSNSRYSVYSLEGGIGAWQAAGLPVVFLAPAGGLPLPIFRQVQIVVGVLIFLLVALGLSGVHGGFILAGILGAMLALAGVTGWCGLAMLLHSMPWNRTA